MFRLLTIFLLLIVGVRATSDELWNHWKRTHNKVYNGRQEEVNRRAQWERNVKHIQNHNLQYDLGLVTYTLGLNQFTDLSFEEFKAKYLSDFKPNPHFYAQGIPFEPDNSQPLPDSVDWRAYGYVTSVKDQGLCFSSWSFSTTGVVEGQYAKNFGKLKSFSEQQLVDCSYEYGNYGCNGGLVEIAFEYLENNGLEEEKDYEYQAKDLPCMYNAAKARARVTGYRTSQSGNETNLQRLVAEHGPVSVLLGIEQDFVMYSGGIYQSDTCSPSDLNHAMLAVGYGTENDKLYWIVKNSWKTSWGEQGYIRLARNTGNMCGIASMASVPVVKRMKN